MSHVLDVFRGSNTVGVRKHGHEALPVHGLGKSCFKTNAEAEKLLRRMVVMVSASGASSAQGFLQASHARNYFPSQICDQSSGLHPFHTCIQLLCAPLAIISATVSCI